MASRDVHGAPLPPFDGSTWDPFAHRLLLTTEDPDVPGVFQATVGYPSVVRDLDGVLGRGGYEGVQVDPLGRLWLVEDQSGDTGTLNANAKQPNSFLYRFIPTDPANLTAGGTLQALRVISLRSGDPIVFHDGQADADITSQDVRDLHTYGTVFRTRWVSVHDTGEDGTASFDANALAKAARATPFKRPENGVFAPGSGFRAFVFTETGDTIADSEAGAALGGFGAVFKLTQQHPDSSRGRLRLVLRGDKQHTGFDNIAFADRTTALWQRMPATRCTRSVAGSIPCGPCARRPTTAILRHPGRSAWPTWAGTPRPPSTRRSASSTGSRTRRTTRSRGSTCPTETRLWRDCSAPACRSRSGGCAGVCSSRHSTATTSPTS
jgi:hypothetical protein